LLRFAIFGTAFQREIHAEKYAWGRWPGVYTSRSGEKTAAASEIR
jgi:hypothetical protein